MRRLRRPLHHPLAKIFLRSVESLTTSLGDASLRDYLATIRRFLDYLGANYPEVRRLEQLRRDPHILGWLAQLRSHTPPLAKITLVNRVIRLHRLLEDLAWTEQLPARAHLLTADDVPRRDHYLPRSLTPNHDESIQQELLRRNDLTSNVLLLLRHTGMRIGECADLSINCLRPLGQDQWVIHVPLGKLKTERWVPVDSFVCQVINRLRLLRSQDASETGNSFLLARPHGREMLIRRLRAALQEVAAAAGINTRIVPHQFRHTYASDAAWRSHLSRRHEATGSHHAGYDNALSRNNPGRPSTRVSFGSLSSQASRPGASNPTLYVITSSGLGQFDRLLTRRSTHPGDVPAGSP
jgi:site-specific recombinase XerD